MGLIHNENAVASNVKGTALDLPTSVVKVAMQKGFRLPVTFNQWNPFKFK